MMSTPNCLHQRGAFVALRVRQWTSIEWKSVAAVHRVGAEHSLRPSGAFAIQSVAAMNSGELLQAE